MLRFEIKPFDVLFFGSGKPFNIGDVATSIFPPFSNTFASAICSKIYHQFNIDDVSDILKAVYGPFFIKYNKNHNYNKQSSKKDNSKDNIFFYPNLLTYILNVNLKK